MHDKVMGQAQTDFTEAYAQSLRENSDLWPSDMFLFTTHCLVLLIICAKLFSNPTMHDNIMSQT